MEKIKSFDFDMKLFKFKGKDIPFEKFFPENLTMLLVAIMAGCALGTFYSSEKAGLEWYITLPCAVFSGMLVCFTGQYLLENAVDFFKKNNLPKGEAAANLDGYITQEIEAGGWGKAALFHKEREFTVNAASIYENGIEENEKVICLYEQDGFYFVVKINDVYLP
jgi:hypothetical protein